MELAFFLGQIGLVLLSICSFYVGDDDAHSFLDLHELAAFCRASVPLDGSVPVNPVLVQVKAQVT